MAIRPQDAIWMDVLDSIGVSLADGNNLDLLNEWAEIEGADKVEAFVRELREGDPLWDAMRTGLTVAHWSYSQDHVPNLPAELTARGFGDFAAWLTETYGRHPTLVAEA